jgi:hypothetical protein
MTHYWHILHPHPRKFWLEQDIHWLLKCHVAVRINLGIPSIGADMEEAVADSHNIPVYQWAWAPPNKPHVIPQSITDFLEAWRSPNAPTL